ncbi:MAG: hypothetical protein ACFFDN_42635 [Candidatus Hodarchaeota archaeon]
MDIYDKNSLKKINSLFHFYWATIFIFILIAYIVTFQLCGEVEIGFSNLPVNYFLIAGILLGIFSFSLNRYMFKSLKLYKILHVYNEMSNKSDNIEININRVKDAYKNIYLMIILPLIDLNTIFGCLFALIKGKMIFAHQFFMIALLFGLLSRPDFNNIIKLLSTEKSKPSS